MSTPEQQPTVKVTITQQAKNIIVAFNSKAPGIAKLLREVNICLRDQGQSATCKVSVDAANQKSAITIPNLGSDTKDVNVHAVGVLLNKFYSVDKRVMLGQQLFKQLKTAGIDVAEPRIKPVHKKIATDWRNTPGLLFTCRDGVGRPAAINKASNAVTSKLSHKFILPF